MFPVCAIIAFSLGKGLTTLGAMLIVAVCAWGVRLTANWAYTFRGLRYEDWRYVMLAQKSGRFYPIVNLFGIHFVPTLIVFMCMLPAFYAIENGLKAAPLSYVFLLVSLLAALLQLVSDVQMHSFRRSRKGGLIRNGLWKNSRHPNYLGEILMWWGVGLSVFSAAPAKYWLLTGTLANMLMFLFISIPMADRRQSLKPGYDAYRARTRMLLPLPRRGGRP